MLTAALLLLATSPMPSAGAPQSSATPAVDAFVQVCVDTQANAASAQAAAAKLDLEELDPAKIGETVVYTMFGLRGRAWRVAAEEGPAVLFVTTKLGAKTCELIVESKIGAPSAQAAFAAADARTRFPTLVGDHGDARKALMIKGEQSKTAPSLGLSIITVRGETSAYVTYMQPEP